MKIRILLVTLAGIAIVHSSNGQTLPVPKPDTPTQQQTTSKPYIDWTSPELKYDFLNPNGRIPSNFVIKNGAKVYFKIENINKSLYTITINNSEKSLFADKPQIFNLMIPDISKLTSALSQNGANNSAALMDKNQIPETFSAELKHEAEKYIDSRDDFAGKLSTYINYYNTFKNVNSYYNALTELLTDDCHDFPTIKQTKIDLTLEVLKSSLEYTGNSQIEVILGSTLRTNTDNLLKSMDDQYTAIIREQTLFGTITTAYQNALAAEAAKDKGKKADAKILAQITAQQQELLAFKDILDESMAEAKAAKTAIDGVKADFSATMKKTYDKINYSNFTYISPSYTASKDLMEISISIQPKAPLVCDNNYAPFNTTIEGRVTGFKMNFSSGLFVIMGNNVFDQSYHTEAIAGDASNYKIVQNTNKTKIVPALGALMHFYEEKAEGTNWGGAFGLSINNDTHLNYHGGLSALFGNTQRIVITAGVTLSQVKLISDDYQVGGTIPVSVGTIPTSSYYRWGGFVALTYNLSN